MSFLGTALTILRKDLLLELRSREIVTTTTLFALLVTLLSHFAFGLTALTGGDASAGSLWIAIAFSGLLALERTFAREREFDVWSAVRLTPAPAAAIYLGKLAGVLVFLLVIEIALVPIIQVFFHAPLLEHLPSLMPILLAGSFGYAAVGTLFAAMSVRTRLRNLLLGVILYPLVAPLLIAAVKATGAVLAGGGLGAAADWIELMVVIDVIYLVGGLWLFGPLMAD